MNILLLTFVTGASMKYETPVEEYNYLTALVPWIRTKNDRVVINGTKKFKTAV